MLMLCRRIVELVKPLSPRPSGTVDKYTERRCRRVETDGFPARTRTITENSKDNVQLQGSTRRAAESGDIARPERARRDAVAKKAGHGRNDVRVLARIFSTLYGDHTCRHLRSFLSRGVRTHDARVASREDPLQLNLMLIMAIHAHAFSSDSLGL